MTCDRWHLTCDTRHMTCDRWHLTCDIWHLTYDTWHMIPDQIFFKYFIGATNRTRWEIHCLLYAGFLLLLRYFHLHVWWTSPAIPSLLSIFIISPKRNPAYWRHWISWHVKKNSTNIFLKTIFMCHLSHVTCHMSHVICLMSCVTYHMSHVTCCISHVTCHLSHITCH